MADETSARSTPLGIYDRGARAGRSSGEMTAAALAAAWVVLAGGYFALFGTEGTDGLRFVLVLLVIFLPVAMIWVAATAMRATRIMREESVRLQAAVDALRHAYVTQAQAGRPEARADGIARRLDEIATAQRRTEAALASLAPAPDLRPVGAIRPAPAEAPAATAEQPALALGTGAEQEAGPALSTADLIRGLNFPDTAEDKDGFAALRRALRDRAAAQLIQAAQDVLTLLSEEGIYMDDLNPDRARPETWRRFAQGVRGREIAALGGIRDRSSLALTAGRMKQDPIFRDAAHHFLRLFDRNFARFEPQASDAEVSDFADTRSARAFMLLGRVAGTFD